MTIRERNVTETDTNRCQPGADRAPQKPTSVSATAAPNGNRSERAAGPPELTKAAIWRASVSILAAMD